MRFMNEHDLYSANLRFKSAETMNRLYLARTVLRLAEWTDKHSDGWHLWPKPVNAARKAIALIESTTWEANEAQEEVDATDAEVKAALAPIKSFLTRQKVPHSQVIYPKPER